MRTIDEVESELFGARYDLRKVEQRRRDLEYDLNFEIEECDRLSDLVCVLEQELEELEDMRDQEE